MNKADSLQDEALYSGMWAASRSVHTPELSILTWLSLIGYLGTLALTQTIYSQPFMMARWVMLGIFAASSSADLILVAARGGFRAGIGNGQILAVYLLATFSSVIYAENWLFSGLRWASHAVMLVVFLLILPQIITLKQIQRLLSFVKYLMAFLVVVSWLFPAPESIVASDTLYKGIMGNANTMGHIAFITTFLFVQSFLTSKAPFARYLYGFFGLAAMMTVWKSGARSSMIALTLSLLLLLYYYRKETKGIVLIAMLLGSLAMVSLPQLPQEVFRFAQKSTDPNNPFDPTQSRVPVWSAAYEGFSKRPLLGWGFGADSNISKQWKIQITAVGTVERDAVNDFMFMMEGGGVVGLLAYLLLIWLVLRLRPNNLQRAILRNFSRTREDFGYTALHNDQVTLFILSICLVVLNQFDNSALSAGNLISVTLWLSTGCAGAIRYEIS